MLASVARCWPYAALRPTLLYLHAMHRLFSTALCSLPPRTKPQSATPRAILHDAPTSATAFLSHLRADDSVVLGDVDNVLHKLHHMYRGGLASLHVVTDFDCTLTKYWVDGKRSATSHAVVASSQQLPEQAKQDIDALYSHYYPIEVNATLTEAEKLPHMETWWRAVHDVLVGAQLCRGDITAMVSSCPVTWRAGLERVMALCAQQDVPVLVFSAGLADVILEILKQQRLYTHNVHVISNAMRFDQQPPHVCIGFEDPVIHVLNKNEGALRDANVAYFAEVAHRSNVLLMGDSLGDLKMSHGMAHDVCLNVGFLNHDTEALLPQYRAAYDIVLLHDASMQWVKALLQGMHAHTATPVQ